MFFICKYRTVDVNVLKKAVIHFRALGTCLDMS